jgi:hypothetical protein
VTWLKYGYRTPRVQARSATAIFGVPVKNGGVSAIHFAVGTDKSPSTARDVTPSRQRKERSMPLINVKLIEGVFNDTQKKKMVTDLTDAMVAIEGEAMRQVTWS